MFEGRIQSVNPMRCKSLFTLEQSNLRVVMNKLVKASLFIMEASTLSALVAKVMRVPFGFESESLVSLNFPTKRATSASSTIES